MKEQPTPETTNVLRFVPMQPDEMPTKAELRKLDDLTEIVFDISHMVAAYLKTPRIVRDDHAFAEQIRALAHQIENWADSYEFYKGETEPQNIK